MSASILKHIWLISPHFVCYTETKMSSFWRNVRQFGNYQSDNFWCSQWRKLCQIDYFVIWVYMHDTETAHHNQRCLVWWHSSGSTMAQVMAWCLTASSHYLNQCWLPFILWHSPETIFLEVLKISVQGHDFANFNSIIISISPMSQWVQEVPSWHIHIDHL